MDNAEVRNIISNYVSVAFIRATSRFINTKKENLLENTVTIYDYKNNMKLSNNLYDFISFYEMKSFSDIQFIFKNEYLVDAVLTLNRKEQLIIYYKYFLCMTDNEIAKVMHVTRQTITRTKLSILQKLRKSLEETKKMWR